jgi:hypothetical protein
MQIRNTNGACSAADGNPDMMEPKDPVSVKINDTVNNLECGPMIAYNEL